MGESGTATIDEVNHFSSSLSNNAAAGYDSSKSSSLPANASPAPTAILGGGSEHTESSLSHDIPIPIFKSSQYSIQRRRTRSNARTTRHDERRPPTSSPGSSRKRRQNMSAVRLFSSDYGKVPSKRQTIFKRKFNSIALSQMKKSLPLVDVDIHGAVQAGLC